MWSGLHEGEQEYWSRFEEEAVAMMSLSAVAARSGGGPSLMSERSHAAIPASLKDAAPGGCPLVHALNVQYGPRLVSWEVAPYGIYGSVRSVGA